MNYERNLSQKIDELMNGSYSPFNPDNFYSALGELTEQQIKTLAEFTSTDQLQAGLFLRQQVFNHWSRLARTEADAQIEREHYSCARCHGDGCPNCNEDQRMEKRA